MNTKGEAITTFRDKIKETTNTELTNKLDLLTKEINEVSDPTNNRKSNEITDIDIISRELKELLEISGEYKAVDMNVKEALKFSEELDVLFNKLESATKSKRNRRKQSSRGIKKKRGTYSIKRGNKTRIKRKTNRVNNTRSKI